MMSSPSQGLRELADVVDTLEAEGVEVTEVDPQTLPESRQDGRMTARLLVNVSCEDSEQSEQHEVEAEEEHQELEADDDTSEDDSETYECDECGEEFPTEAGRNIHRGHVHDHDDDEDVTESETEDSETAPSEPPEEPAVTDGGALAGSGGTNTITCQNCGAHVTPDYVRVFTPEDVDEPRACPECPDKVRDGAEVRDARASRSDARGVDDGADPNITTDGGDD